MNPSFSPETWMHNQSHQILDVLCQLHCLQDGQNALQSRFSRKLKHWSGQENFEKGEKTKIQSSEKSQHVILVEDFLRVLKGAWIRISLCMSFT